MDTCNSEKQNCSQEKGHGQFSFFSLRLNGERLLRWIKQDKVGRYLRNRKRKQLPFFISKRENDEAGFTERETYPRQKLTRNI